jgi:hypothetical protein
MRKLPFIVALAAVGIFFCGWASSTHSPGWILIIAVVMGVGLFSATAGVLIVPIVERNRILRRRDDELNALLHRSEVLRRKVEQKRYIEQLRESSPQQSPDSTVVIDNEPPNETMRHRTAWREFWITVVIWSFERGGVVSWRDKEKGGFETIISRYEDWSAGIAVPFVKAGWLSPVYQGGKTKLMEGITFTHIMSQLANDNLPPLPHTLPPAIHLNSQQSTAETPSNTDENNRRVFSTA